MSSIATPACAWPSRPSLRCSHSRCAVDVAFPGERLLVTADDAIWQVDLAVGRL